MNNYAISDLFNIEQEVVYKIPRYQREYTWKKEQWEDLFDDLLENNPGYFLGSIICINQSTDALKLPELELVDGQQRLTTLSLLFAAMYQALKELEDELDEEQQHELFNLKRKLVLKKSDDGIRIIPQIHNHNQDDYRAVLSDIEVISPFDKPAYAGNRKIYRAFWYFQNRIENMVKDQEKQISVIMEFLDKVNKASLVKIEVVSHADAYTLFESLNNRGVPLSAIDIIKNKLLAILERTEPGKIDKYFLQWNNLLNYLGDDYAVQERFFRQYYNAFKDELKSVVQVSVATRSNLIQIYEKMIDNDAKKCLGNLSEAGRSYAQLLLLNPAGTIKELEKPLQDLERIQGAPSYLLMLHLLLRKDQLQVNNRQLADIVRLLVCFFVRRNLTDSPPTRDLTIIFMDIINRLAGKTGIEVVEEVKGALKKVSVSNQEFRNELEGPIYDQNANVTRFILCALAEQGMTKETWVDLWKHENKMFVWTIEHIFPQGENIPASWVKMIADGNKKKAEEYRLTHVHKLGNLTISGFNSMLSNKSFLEKRDRKDSDGHYVGYKNGLIINKDLATNRSWSIAQIDERTQKLVKETVKLFKMG
ncbi:MAG TPA: DUF262 domain-containing HNH endonuclease family protein [Cyclobacteriaceae bacterium]|nr:DUF262 domain-containing HNH endonuclease family protein [Cyclobacteriaceae bacterium]